MTNTDSFLITIRSQPKHGLLYAALKQYGHLDDLALALGVCKTSACHWINLRSYPKSIFGGGYETRRKRIDDGLRKTIGVGALECWPKEVRDFIDNTQHLTSLIFEQTKEVPLPRLTAQACKMLTYEGNQERTANVHEAREAITDVLKTLNYREREIIKLRYGLGDGVSYTLEEVAHIFKVTRDRIRQIEAKAIRKMQQPSRSSRLVGFTETSE